MQVDDVPQTHTLFKQRLDNVFEPHTSPVDPHWQVFKATHVSVVKEHAGLQRAMEKISSRFRIRFQEL